MATDTDVLVATRRVLHVVAEHVLLPDLYDHTARIGLRPTAGGFGTPGYRHAAGFVRRLRVEGTDVVDERDDRVVTRVSLTTPLTLRELRAALEVTATAPSDVYDPGSDGSPRQTLVADPASTAVVAALFATTREALALLADEVRADPGRAGAADDDIGPVHLWPEHFDLARSIEEVTYGASPGDDAHPEPYLYAAPWDPSRPDDHADDASGISRPALPVPPPATVLAWFRRARAILRA